jgi:hypothetical protein
LPTFETEGTSAYQFVPSGDVRVFVELLTPTDAHLSELLGETMSVHPYQQANDAKYQCWVSAIGPGIGNAP